MNIVLFVNLTIGFSENLFLVFFLVFSQAKNIFCCFLKEIKYFTLFQQVKIYLHLFSSVRENIFCFPKQNKIIDFQFLSPQVN